MRQHSYKCCGEVFSKYESIKVFSAQVNELLSKCWHQVSKCFVEVFSARLIEPLSKCGGKMLLPLTEKLLSCLQNPPTCTYSQLLTAQSCHIVGSNIVWHLASLQWEKSVATSDWEESRNLTTVNTPQDWVVTLRKSVEQETRDISVGAFDWERMGI